MLISLLSKSTFGFSEGDIYDMIDRIEIEIGSVLTDTLWRLECFIRTYYPESKLMGIEICLLKILVLLIMLQNNLLSSTFGFRTGLALPLISLQLHEVKINIKWELANTTAIMMDYAFLDEDLRKQYVGNSHEYLIEQVRDKPTTLLLNSIRMYFNHPVKELIWVNSGSPDGYSLSCQFALREH